MGGKNTVGRQRRSFYARFKACGTSLWDTEVFFSAGDFAAAYLTAEIFGIAINGLAFLVAVAGRIGEALFDRKPLGLGFYSMGVVSGITTVSIFANGMGQHGQGFLVLFGNPALDLWFGIGAFASWTLANCIAGYRKSHPGSATTRPAGDHQTYFCLGSILATHAKLTPLVFFVLGLARILTNTRQGLESGSPWKQFYNKHATPQRLRAIAYAISALMAALAASTYVLPYLLWMFGNLVFDNGGLDRTIKGDFIALLRQGSRGTKQVSRTLKRYDLGGWSVRGSGVDVPC